MVYTTIAWRRSVNTSNVLTELTTVADPHIAYTATRFFVPEEMSYLAGAYAASSSITNARIDSPSLRRIAPLNISPLNPTSVEPLSPQVMMDFFDNPVKLDVGEQIGAFSAGAETAATDHVVILFLSPGPVEKVTGPCVTVRATASVTLRAWEWTPVVPVLESSIPVGRYRIIGFRAQSDNLIAARIVVPGQPWRPGVLGTDAVSDIQHERFRFGRAGVMIEFNTSEFFAVECLAAAADTSEIFWFDLQKVE